MSNGIIRGPHEARDREAAHEAKILEVIRSRIREARRSRINGKMVFEINLTKGGPSAVYTEISVTYKILEECKPDD